MNDTYADYDSNEDPAETREEYDSEDDAPNQSRNANNHLSKYSSANDNIKKPPNSTKN